MRLCFQWWIFLRCYFDVWFSRCVLGLPGVEVPLGEGWSPRPVGTKRLPGPGCLLWWGSPLPWVGSPEVPPSLHGQRECQDWWGQIPRRGTGDGEWFPGGCCRHVGSLQAWDLLLLPAEDHLPRSVGSGPRRWQLLVLSVERVGRSSLGLLGTLEAKSQMDPEPRGLSM